MTASDERPRDAGSCAIIVMAKAPVAGLAKTRLAPALGLDGAARLADRMLAHALQSALGAALGPVELCAAPDRHHPAFAPHLVRPTLLSADQCAGDIGRRMQHALQRWLDQGRRAVLIGTDAPALDAAMLRRAAAMLEHADAVFVPALDGGYVLVGLSRPLPFIFDDMAWSVATVMAETRRRLHAAGVLHAELEPVADIDTPQDLAHLPPGWGRL
jgi:rSAM/selenodomain-associated transferase 1